MKRFLTVLQIFMGMFTIEDEEIDRKQILEMKHYFYQNRLLKAQKKYLEKEINFDERPVQQNFVLQFIQTFNDYVSQEIVDVKKNEK